MRFQLLIAVVLLHLTIPLSTAIGGDWPMWRGDAGRSGVSHDALPDELQLQWVRQLPKPVPAWPASQAKLQFDRSYQPVVTGRRMFVGSSANDSITAYDTRTGGELWRFFTEGPVRFAPVASDGKVYAVSDDGHLYCLNAETGELNWKVNGGPAKRSIIGNDRVVSTWPARGGVVLADDVLYFAASIWPSMGIFIHAVDAETGRILWTNSETGSDYTVHPHGAASFGSIVPQGYLAVAGDYLVVPGGRSKPAVFNRKTGELVHFDFGGKRSGGFQVMAAAGGYWVGGELCRLEDGKRLTNLDLSLMTDKDAVSLDDDKLIIQTIQGEEKTKTTLDRRGKPKTESTYELKKKRAFELSSDLPETIFCRAGNRIYLGGENKIVAVRWPDDSAEEPLEADWSTSIEETPTSMLAGDDRLFVVTDNAKLYCFGADDRPVARHELPNQELPPTNDEVTAKAEPFIEACTSNAGYAVSLGVGSGRLIDELVRRTNLHIVTVESDAEKLEDFRTRMNQAGLYGTRTAAFDDEPLAFSYPPYFANLMLAEDQALTKQIVQASRLRHLFSALRPYGGVLVFPSTEAQHQAAQKLVEQKSEQFAGAKLERQGGLTYLRRVGSLPGSDEWTHQYGDAANSVVSKDQLVKTPLGVLWFGGPSNDKVLPRHGHGPSPQVAGGRLVIEGPDMLRAVDVYTGRVHWEKDLPGVGNYYNVTRHFSGAGEVGSNYVTLRDQVYVIHEDKILELDAATGETTHRYELPESADPNPPNWGYIASAGGHLVATSSPVKLPGGGKEAENKATIPEGFTAVVKPHGKWKYLAMRDPQGDWTAADFPAKDWKQGTAGFGYGDGDDRTELKPMRGKFPRVYIRREISESELKNLRDVALKINYDDAFIAYLNGKEIVRSHVKEGRGRKASGVGSHEAKGYETFAVKDFLKLIRPGTNVLAIEGHNVGLSSSDFSLDPYLIARNSSSEKTPSEKVTKTLESFVQTTDKSSSSRRLVVFDRKTREKLWSRDAVYSFRHNGIAVTEDRIFCIDSLSPAQLQLLKRRGIKAEGRPRLLALDARTGREIWSTSENVFGTFLNYSKEYDVLLQGGSAYRDRALDEVGTGLIAYRGSSGEVLWEKLKLTYNGPCLIWRDKIITNGSRGFQLGLFDGEKTGWTFSRMYGCNTVLGSEHLLTFRSGAAGFCDLTGDSGTGNLGGFRSSCTSNLIAADGVLNAPDYTRTCICAYQNQTSVAWIHMPEADAWTFSNLNRTDDVQQIGWNLGAPGDRRSQNGTLWFEYPSQGGPSPKLDVESEPEDIEWFEDHASMIEGDRLPWVAASGGEGIRKLVLAVPDSLTAQKNWTVQLYFSEPRDVKAGDRVFSIQLQDQEVTDDCDIVREAGAARTPLIKQYENIPSGQYLTVTLTPKKGSSRKPILCGIEILPARNGAPAD